MKRSSALARPGERACCRGARVVIAIAWILAPIAPASAAGLNDTGQNSCYDTAGGVVACSLGGQDARYGRDAAAALGQVSKVGAGAAGFDYTKIGNNGDDLPASAVAGGGPTDWACTRDNVTGLTWEIKTAVNTDLRYMLHFYRWYSTAANNGGFPGSQAGNACNGTLPQCNTAAYVQAVNDLGLCGNSNWRLPTFKELQSLLHYGAIRPAIDTTWFPNTPNSAYWSATSYPFGPGSAYTQDFTDAQPYANDKSANSRVRLVHSGP